MSDQLPTLDEVFDVVDEFQDALREYWTTTMTRARGDELRRTREALRAAIERLHAAAILAERSDATPAGPSAVSSLREDCERDRESGAGAGEPRSVSAPAEVLRETMAFVGTDDPTGIFLTLIEGERRARLERNEALAALQSVREDSERLDWLFGNLVTREILGRVRLVAESYFGTDGEDFRRTIDRARGNAGEVPAASASPAVPSPSDSQETQ